MVYQGIYQGLQQGLVQGIGTGYGPALLADFNFTQPNALNLSAMFANADSWWDMQETSGTTLSDQTASGNDLTVSGALVGQVSGSAFYSGGYGNKRAAEIAATTDYAAAGTSTAGDSDSSTSVAAFVVFETDGAPATNSVLLGKGFAGTYWRLQFAAGGQLRVFIDDGAAGEDLATIAIDHSDGIHYAGIVIDRTADLLWVYSDLGSASVDISARGACEPAQAFRLGNLGGSNAAHVHILGSGLFSGAAAESAASDVAAAWTHATDPTGLLTTATRSGLISVPTSASTVGHFGADQLPTGYSALLDGGAGGFGLYCNSALTNMLSHSEAWNGNWTVSGSTTDGVGGTAPDGFYTAEYITATSASGLIYLNTSPPTINTDYTLQVWVKRGPGMSSDVPGKIFLRDLAIGAGSDVTQTFTATDTWQRVLVTLTLGGTATGLRAYMGFDSASVSDELMFWGAQVIEGTQTVDAPYIRTTGSAASLAVPDYAAAVAGGDLIKAAQGEIEAVYSYYQNTGGSQYIFDAHPASGSANRRISFINAGTQPVFRTYDSSGAGGSLLISGSISPGDSEHVGVCRYDSTGGVDGQYSATHQTDSATKATTATTFAASDTVTSIQLGATSAVASPMCGIISRLRIWGGPR